MQDWFKVNALASFKDDVLLMLPKNLENEHAAVFLTADAAKPFGVSSLPRRLAEASLGPVSLCFPDNSSLPPNVVFSWGAGCYEFRRYKDQAAHLQKKPRTQPSFASLVLPPLSPAALAEQRRLLQALYLVRDLISTPTEDLGPQQLEDAVRAVARETGAVVEATVGEELLRKNFPQIHAVGRAAAKGREPRLIDLRWGQEAHPRVTLVGKGVCYDTGGLSIKDTSGMLMMKKDMGGSANVLGLALLIMKAQLPVRLRLLIPAVENDIAGGAYRNGDVLTARDGRTTEVCNTDAEGRLILADALVEASSELPELIVDMATLTGARTVALGTQVGAVFANEAAEADAARLQALGRQLEDPLWQLPLWAPYLPLLDSPIADLRNVEPGSSTAGAIKAALYLNEFVHAPGASEAPAPRWLHIDFGAWIFANKPGRPVGGEAQGIRALFKLIEEKFPGRV